MGLFKSDEEKLAEERQKRAWRRQELDQQLASIGPPGAPYVDWLQVNLGGQKEGDSGDPPSSIEAIAYIGQVGIPPEDVYSIYPSWIQSGGGVTTFVRELTIIYRDRPEYAPRRERYWQAAMRPAGSRNFPQ